MANMLNRAYKAQKHAALALQKTDTYENGKKRLCVFLEDLTSTSKAIRQAINEVSNVLPEYEETPNKNYMKSLLLQAIR